MTLVYTNGINIFRRTNRYFRRTRINRIGFIVFGIVSLSTLAMADYHVWTETSTVRVVRDSLPGAAYSVHLSAARNEWISFQILVRSEVPLVIQRIEPLEFEAKGGELIPTSNVHLFRQHQIHLTVGTERNGSFRAGWYPDPLIPFCNPLTEAALDGRLRALPFDLPANETHGFWIDIHVPVEAKPGLYRNTFRICAEGDHDTDIPVELTVWDFQLPDTPTMQTAFGSPVQVMQAYYIQRAKEGKEVAPSDWPAIEKQCSKLMSEHRINAVPLTDYLSPRIDHAGGYNISAERIEALRQFIDQYHVNALQAPNPGDVFKNPERRDRDKLRLWLKAIDVAVERLDRPNVLFYFYLVDEPNNWETYDFISKWGKAIHEAKSVVKVMVTESTKPRNVTWGNLYGAVNIWCPLFPEFDPLSAASRLEHGEALWVYTALCQEDRTPWWHIDYPLLNYRVPAWIAWRYRISGLLYWDMAHWKEVDDPWGEAWTYHHPQARGKVYNGEGTLVYPARPVGYDGIVPSLRLKALRDGIQDYDYLTILERLGLAEEAREIVLPLANSWFKWNEDPVAYEKARVKLAEMIISAKAKK